MFCLELWETLSTPEEVEICLVKMDDSLLKRLTIHFLEPSILFLLLQLRYFIGLNIPGNCFLGFLVYLYFLFKKIVVDESNRTKVFLKQLLLGLVWI